ncbi:hypothetical protein [Nocardioides limicola]|uniref:hypothetical protein n=1 Tax=Nocardioides limicola TaxID=2803368 RepID=UPI00193C42F1|nr:hypothetical protein [Nocardioides sp. DJM-14]
MSEEFTQLGMDLNDWLRTSMQRLTETAEALGATAEDYADTDAAVVNDFDRRHESYAHHALDPRPAPVLPPAPQPVTLAEEAQRRIEEYAESDGVLDEFGRRLR